MKQTCGFDPVAKDIQPQQTGSRKGLKAQLLRGGLVGIAVRVASVLAGLVLSISLARILGPENYGVYAFVFSIIAFIGLPVKMGLPTLILRETAKADVASDGAAMSGIWKWSNRAMGLMAICAVSGTAFYLWVVSGIDTPRSLALLCALPLIPLFGFTEARSAALNGLRRFGLGGTPGKVIRPLLVAGILAIFASQQKSGVSANQAILLHGLGAAVALCIAIAFLRSVRPDHPGFDAPKTQVRTWLAAILPLTAISGLQIVSHNTDILMIGALATDADVGLYRVALSGANIALFGLTTVNLVLRPYFARAWASGDAVQLQKLATAGARVSIAAALPILVVFWLGGVWLLTLMFGADYNGAYWALVLLCIGQSISALFGPVGNLLTMAGKEWIALTGLLVSTVMNILLNWLLIPIYGIDGAAIATGISVAIWNIILWMLAIKTLGINCSVIPLPSRR